MYISEEVLESSDPDARHPSRLSQPEPEPIRKRDDSVIYSCGQNSTGSGFYNECLGWGTAETIGTSVGCSAGLMLIVVAGFYLLRWKKARTKLNRASIRTWGFGDHTNVDDGGGTVQQSKCRGAGDDPATEDARKTAFPAPAYTSYLAQRRAEALTSSRHQAYDLQIPVAQSNRSTENAARDVPAYPCPTPGSYFDGVRSPRTYEASMR